MNFDVKQEIKKFEKEFPVEMLKTFIADLSDPKTTSKLREAFNQAGRKLYQKHLSDECFNNWLEKNDDTNLIKHPYASTISINQYIREQKKEVSIDHVCLLTYTKDYKDLKELEVFNGTNSNKEIALFYVFNHEMLHALTNHKLINMDVNYKENVADAFATIRLIQEYKEQGLDFAKIIAKNRVIEAMPPEIDIEHFTVNSIDAVIEFAKNTDFSEMDLKESLNFAIMIADINKISMVDQFDARTTFQEFHQNKDALLDNIDQLPKKFSTPIKKHLKI